MLAWSPGSLLAMIQMGALFDVEQESIWRVWKRRCLSGQGGSKVAEMSGTF